MLSSVMRCEARFHVGNDQATDLPGGDIGNVEAANVAIALDQSDNGLPGLHGAGGAAAAINARAA
jgi:hypothetical protein